MPKAKSAPQAVGFEIPAMDLQTVQVPLVGTSPLICHQFSQKAIAQMLAKQTLQAKQPKGAKDPLADYADSLYWLSPRPDILTPDSIAAGRFGFPSIGFKSAAVDACSYLDAMTKVQARGAFHVLSEYVEIRGAPRMREDVARVGMGTADLRYRGEFPEWSVTLPIQLNARVISPAQLLHLFDTAGFAVGVGDWRPQRDGQFGRFRVARG